MVDQTPVLDIKPYIPQYDSPECLNTLAQDANATDLQSLNLESRYEVPVYDDTLDNDLNESYDSMDVRVMDGEENNGRNSSLGDRNRRNENLQASEAVRYPE